MALGSVGWQIVQMEGGWEQICQSLTDDNLNTSKAQWRNLARVLLQRQGTNEDDSVKIQHKTNDRGLLSFAEIMKNIPGIYEST
jgi:hypothetical protein